MPKPTQTHATPQLRRAQGPIFNISPSPRPSSGSAPRFDFSQRSSQFVTPGRGNSSPSVPATSRRRLQRIESIEDGENEYDGLQLSTQTPMRDAADLSDDEIEGSSAPQLDDGNDPDDNAAINRQNTQALDRSQGLDTDLPLSSWEEDLAFEEQASKRRRLFAESRPRPSLFETAFDTSSSQLLQFPDERATSPTPDSRPHQANQEPPPSARQNRFKFQPLNPPTSTIPDSTQTLSTPSRPSFKLPPLPSTTLKEDTSITIEDEIKNSNLPSTIPLSLFLSPHKSNKHSNLNPYLPNGRAEQVRSWVLELAETQQQHSVMQEMTKAQGTNVKNYDAIIDVKQVRAGTDMTLIQGIKRPHTTATTTMTTGHNTPAPSQSEDTDKQEPSTTETTNILLLGSPSSTTTSSKAPTKLDLESSKAIVRVGSVIGVLPGPLTWDMQIEGLSWTVVVSWEILESG